jgi:hypothetical protein
MLCCVFDEFQLKITLIHIFEKPGEFPSLSLQCITEELLVPFVALAQMPLGFIAGFTSLLFYGFSSKRGLNMGLHYMSLVVGWLGLHQQMAIMFAKPTPVTQR